MNRWYVVWAHTGSEQRLIAKIANMPGVGDVFSPAGIRYTRKDGTWSSTEVLYFPGYLFLQCEMSAEIYYRLREASGVIGWLGKDQNFPTHVPESEMEQVFKLREGHFDDLPLRVDKRQRRANGEMQLLGKAHRISVGWWPEGATDGEEDSPGDIPEETSATAGAAGERLGKGSPLPKGSESDHVKQLEAAEVDPSPGDTESEHSPEEALDS